MPHSTEANKNTTGLICLALIGRFHNKPVDPDHLDHQYGEPGEDFSFTHILRAAKALGLKSRRITSDWHRLEKTPLPAIARHSDGHFFVIAALRDAKVLIHDPLEQQPLLLPREIFEASWDKELILFSSRSGLAGGSGGFDFRWFVPALIRHRKLFAEVLLASFFLQLFALLTPLFFQVVVDKVLVHNGLSTLDVIGAGMLLIIVFEVVLGGLRTYVFSHTTNRVDVMLGARLYRHLLALPLSYFKARRVGDSVARVRELENIRNFLTGSSLTLVVDLFFTLVFFVVLFHYSPLLTAIVAGTLPFYIALSVFITPVLRRRLDEKFNRGAENQAFLVESVTGVETLKSMAVEPQMQRRWEEQLAGYVSASFKSNNLGNIANQSASLISKVGAVLILWIGATQVMAGALTVGQLIAFNMIAARISGPILRLVQLWQDFQQAGISVRRLGDILNTPAEPGYNPGRASLPPLQGEVRFDHVNFRYAPDGQEILNDMDFVVKPGEVVGIVGRSGSGKSTLARLIQRLHTPQNGRVLIDGVDLALVETAWLRRQVGVVLQENILFNRSIRDNIALADPGMPMLRIVQAAKSAGAHEFILELPEGYDTLVSEQGANLSGGQRQRVAIARALVGNPRILIFDEATSALDYESESIIQANMRDICQQRTVFIIAHRLSSVRRCDRILVLDRGRLVEDGDHQSLCQLDGIYHRLYRLQNTDAGKPVTGKVG